MKSAKITACTFKQSFNSQHGMMHSHTITLSNGDSGEINSKEQNPPFLNAGETLWYELTPNGKYAPKIKRMKAPDGVQEQQAQQNNIELSGVIERIARLEEVVKQLVKHTKLVYVAPKAEQPKPQGKVNGEMAKAEVESAYDNSDLPF